MTRRIYTYYDKLSVSRSANDDEIVDAYNKLFEKYSSSKSDSEKQQFERILAAITTAYENLIDPISRTTHDEWIDGQDKNLLSEISKTPKNLQISQTVEKVVTNLNENLKSADISGSVKVGFNKFKNKIFDVKELVDSNAKKLQDSVAEKLKQQRLEAEKREVERLKQQKLEAERKRLEAEKFEAERLKQQKLETERKKLESEKREAERLKQQKLEAERKRLEAEKFEAERLKQQKLEAERKKLEKEESEKSIISFWNSPFFTEIQMGQSVSEVKKIVVLHPMDGDDNEYLMKSSNRFFAGYSLRFSPKYGLYFIVGLINPETLNTNVAEATLNLSIALLSNDFLGSNVTVLKPYQLYKWDRPSFVPNNSAVKFATLIERNGSYLLGLHSKDYDNATNSDENTVDDDGRSYEQILGLSSTFTKTELDKAYKVAASRYHPDKYIHMSEAFRKEAAQEFVKVQNAYDRLKQRF